jgi:hypothetical protein
MDDRSKEETREEWRELGFFYDQSGSSKQFVGSKAGLLRLRDLLLDYVADPRNDAKSEHEHYGPYMSLEVMTWSEPGIDGHAICGSMDDLRRLAGIIEREVEASTPGSRIEIREEYACDAEYDIVLEVRDDGFDPASADPTLVV